MKKLILKILSLIAAFILGIVCMSYYQTAGNNDLTETMAAATLPLVTMERGGRHLNMLHGYTAPMEGSFIRDAVLPLPEERILRLEIQCPNRNVRGISYEVRSLDTTRLIEDGQVTEYFPDDEQIEVQLALKDLLDPGEEYLLVLHLELDRGREAFYYTRFVNISETHMEDCLRFAEMIHNASFDKENTVPITQYLEPDSSADNNSLDHVTIHSRYKQVIWGDMDVKPSSGVRIYITEVDDSVTSLRMEYEVSFENEKAETEMYEIKESYRVRYTDQRMYLLNYDRTMNRIFDPELDLFSDEEVMLGILNESVEYRKNEEENVVGFVQNGELWCYDAAQNKLSYVFGFRDGDDLRASYGEHAIRIIDIDESGSMNFMVYGYMNRGLHEGRSGVAVYAYDSLTNSVEELVFIESKKPFQVLQTEVGSLAYINRKQQFYLYYQGNICKIDLNTREYTEIVTGISPENCMISDDGRTIAWYQENYMNEEVFAETVELLNLETERSRNISAEEGFYIQPLGFMGTDFIYGEARKDDIQRDATGKYIFPMGYVVILDESGSMIREFPYEEQGKYVVSVSIESNRISLECVAKNGEGGYVEAAPEPITNNTVETVEKISLDIKNSGVKKREYFFSLSGGRSQAKLKYLTPRQVRFEGSRNVEIEEGEGESYFVYAFDGKFAGAYTALNTAVLEAYDKMGVVVDSSHSYLWERGGRKTRTELTGMENPQQKPEESSLQAALEILLGTQNVYTDITRYLEAGDTPSEILTENLNGRVLNLSGCSVSMILYYVSEGYPVLALEGGSEAELITGYDVLNIVLMDPITGSTYRKGQNDSTQMFEELGNLFMVCLPPEE